MTSAHSSFRSAQQVEQFVLHVASGGHPGGGIDGVILVASVEGIADAQRDQFGIDRAVDEVVGSGVQAGQSHLAVILAPEHHQEDVFGPVDLAQPPCNVDARHIGQTVALRRMTCGIVRMAVCMPSSPVVVSVTSSPSSSNCWRSSFRLFG